MNRKLLLIGTNCIHTYNYKDLVADFFSEIILITNNSNPSNSNSEFCVDFSLKNPIKSFQSQKKIRNIIIDFKPDIIHIQQANSVAYHAIKACKDISIPIIVTAWGSDILHTPNTGYFLKKMAQYILKNANYFTSDSYYMAYEMQKLLPSKHLDITIANFGINNLCYSSQKENIIYSNRAHESLYRIDKIIIAFKKFSEKHPDWKLEIAGKGILSDNLKSLAESLSISDKINFNGWVNNEKNAELYNKAKIFISVPESDATSISLLEALASGCVPIVSNLPANHEWIIDGLNGIIVNNIEDSFIESGLSIDTENLNKINSFLVKNKATKEINKMIFNQLYTRAINND